MPRETGMTPEELLVSLEEMRQERDRLWQAVTKHTEERCDILRERDAAQAALLAAYSELMRALVIAEAFISYGEVLEALRDAVRSRWLALTDAQRAELSREET